MTGNLFLDSLISLGAIAVMVIAARIAFGAHEVPVNESAARERLAADEPDFNPRAWLIDRDGRAALAAGDLEFAVVSRLGGDLVTRRFRPGGANVTTRQGGVEISFPDAGSARVMIVAEGAVSWARKLSGVGVVIP
ncbi:MAG: hypothetical protein AAGD92_14045 [Pseudomonadota bacterium]